MAAKIWYIRACVEYAHGHNTLLSTHIEALTRSDAIQQFTHMIPTYYLIELSEMITMWGNGDQLRDDAINVRLNNGRGEREFIDKYRDYIVDRLIDCNGEQIFICEEMIICRLY